MIDILPGEVGFEEASDEAKGDTIFCDVLLGEGSKTFRAGLKFDNEKSGGFSELLPVFGTPFAQVSKDVGKEIFFQWFLKVLVSLNDALENFNHSLDTIPFALGFEEVDWRSFVVEVGPSRLE
jgi:hypothetical protein